jgi:hypothetical protein
MACCLRGLDRGLCCRGGKIGRAPLRGPATGLAALLPALLAAIPALRSAEASLLATSAELPRLHSAPAAGVIVTHLVVVLTALIALITAPILAPLGRLAFVVLSCCLKFAQGTDRPAIASTWWIRLRVTGAW